MRQTRGWPIMLGECVVVLALVGLLALGTTRYLPALLDGPGLPPPVATATAEPPAAQTSSAIQQAVYQAFGEVCATVIAGQHTGGALCPERTPRPEP